MLLGSLGITLYSLFNGMPQEPASHLLGASTQATTTVRENHGYLQLRLFGILISLVPNPPTFICVSILSCVPLVLGLDFTTHTVDG